MKLCEAIARVRALGLAPTRAHGQVAARGGRLAISPSLRSTPCPSQRLLCRGPFLNHTRSFHLSQRHYKDDVSSGHVSSHAAPSTASGALLKTPLYDFHVAHGATMVPFASYLMPLTYALPHSAVHAFARMHAALFDVSHMWQHVFRGRAARALLERLTPLDVADMRRGEARLACLLNTAGGIVDDCMVTCLADDAFYVVTNAGRRDAVRTYLTTEMEHFAATVEGQPDLRWDTLDGWGLLALQGPEAELVLDTVLADSEQVKLGELGFGQCTIVAIKTPDGTKVGPCLVSRGGYTGEDGFEISIPPQHAVAVAESLVYGAGSDRLQLAGLGARDSLRLEAGMCLYGHDLDESVTPVEAGLAWIMGKERKTRGGFNGAETILPRLVPQSKGGTGVERRRVGFVVEGPPAREGAVIVNDQGETIGAITSGCPSPTLQKNIAMGYIKHGYHKAGTEVKVLVRRTPRKAVVTKMPFVPAKYKRVESRRQELCYVPALAEIVDSVPGPQWLSIADL